MSSFSIGPPAKPKKAFIAAASYREAVLTAMQLGLWDSDWQWLDAVDFIADFIEDDDLDQVAKWTDAVVEQRRDDVIAGFEWLLERVDEQGRTE